MMDFTLRVYMEMVRSFVKAGYAFLPYRDFVEDERASLAMAGGGGKALYLFEA